jgi:hypothetical protein
MKYEPRAVELMKVWNGSKAFTFREVVHLYQVAVRNIQSHEGAMAVVAAWVRAGWTGNQGTAEDMVHEYARAVAAIDETDSEDFFNREIAPILKKESKPAEVAATKTPPMPRELKKLAQATNYLDGNFRKNHPSVK